jgi:hypothetical protein
MDVIRNSVEQGGGPPPPSRSQPDTMRANIIKRADKRRVLFGRCMIFLRVFMIDRVIASPAILPGDLF